jgi:hypothetical protein
MLNSLPVTKVITNENNCGSSAEEQWGMNNSLLVQYTLIEQAHNSENYTAHVNTLTFYATKQMR